MQSRPKIRVLFLGLTDSGPEKLNDEDLGLKRATAARETLIGLGVAKERTERATFGCRAATGDPSDPIAQEKDRRVEVWLIEE
jgi:outer membrane protein OmpA-like peptidoglycan-associated protein